MPCKRARAVEAGTIVLLYRKRNKLLGSALCGNTFYPPKFERSTLTIVPLAHHPSPSR